MSNISIKMDILSKHVHLFLEYGFISKYIKVETWNNSIKSYNVGNQDCKNA